jgi:hypothetical protein
MVQTEAVTHCVVKINQIAIPAEEAAALATLVADPVHKPALILLIPAAENAFLKHTLNPVI